MKLIKLHLTNFKGIASFTLEADGKGVDIYGDNATGKTTLMDAFLWLLFGKDSQNKTDFEIKTLGPDGEPEHGLEHSVEARLQLPNGRQTTLKKTFYEKWTKKRGSATAEFTGHTTDHYLDGVPVKKKEYDELISEIAEEGIFRLLTDPTYFNTQLHWQDRRQLLLEVCGDISDEEVLANEPSLTELADLINEHSIDDLKKIIAAKRTKINKELQKIPVRIDEVQLGLPNIDGLEPGELEKELHAINGLIRDEQQKLTRVEAGGEIAEKNKKLAELETEILRIKLEHQAQNGDKLSAKRKAANELKLRIDQCQSEIGFTKSKAALIDKQAKTIEATMNAKREEWHKIDSEAFVYQEENTCPTCGQELPEQKVAEAREKALARLNLNKSSRLETIAKEGKRLKKEYERLQNDLSDTNASVNRKETELATLKGQLPAMEQEVEKLMSMEVPIEENAQYKAKLHEKALVGEEVAGLHKNAESAKAVILERIEDLQNTRRQIESNKSKIALYAQGKKRTAQLKEEERLLAAEYEALEKQLYLTEEFIRTKVRLLDEKINSKFKLARFKLFNTLINGGIEECCETTHDGVPFGNLNSGARLNVGLDIINVLADHYNFAPAVWIDNAESVTNILPTEGQQIKLVVSERDAELRVEGVKKIKEAV